jgi:hypothetical protein
LTYVKFVVLIGGGGRKQCFNGGIEEAECIVSVIPYVMYSASSIVTAVLLV